MTIRANETTCAPDKEKCMSEKAVLVFTRYRRPALIELHLLEPMSGVIDDRLADQFRSGIRPAHTRSAFNPVA